MRNRGGGPAGAGADAAVVQADQARWPGKQGQGTTPVEEQWPGKSTLPQRAKFEQAFGHDFGSVDVKLGGGRGSGRGAATSIQNGRETIAFDQANPSQEQVAHELVHVVQARQFGEGAPGLAGTNSNSEVEARRLAPAAASGASVDVRETPAAAVQYDDTPAQKIYDYLHSIIDDEPAAVAELRAAPDKKAVADEYFRRYGQPLWAAFDDNASGATLKAAISLCWPHMGLLEKLGYHTSGVNDDEAGILQTIMGASDQELLFYAPYLEAYIQELDAPDAYKARMRAQPTLAVHNLVLFLREGDGYLFDDEGPVATAISRMNAKDRAELWTKHRGEFGMFNDDALAHIKKMCVAADGESPANEDVALKARMKLATEGAGTDEEGATAVVATAQQRRQQLAAIKQQLESKKSITGQPLTEAEIKSLEAQRAQIGDVGALLDISADRPPGDDTFLGMAIDDMGGAELTGVLDQAHLPEFQRARQALLDTKGWTSNVDETAVLEILRGIKGEVTLGPGETLDSLAPAEVQRRQRVSAGEIVKRLKDDPALKDIFDALDDDETSYANAVQSGDTFKVLLADLQSGYEGIDTDEAKILRVAAAASETDRQRLKDEDPAIYLKIRYWATSNDYTAFLRAFDDAVDTGRVPTQAALEEAMDGAGTNVDLVNQALTNLSADERRVLRRGYLLLHRAKGGQTPELGPEDETALAEYKKLYDRLDGELDTNDLDTALVNMLDVPTVDEMLDPDSRKDAAELMLYRQKERLEITAALTDVFSTDDDTAFAAHNDYSAAYDKFLADKDGINPEEFMALVRLDSIFAERFTTYQSTANMAAEIAGTVAAVVATVVVIIMSGPAAPATAPGMLAWLGANSGLIATSAAVSAVAQVGAAEAAGGGFHDTLSAKGAREALSGAINGALAVCGSALAEKAAKLIGLSGDALTAAIARAAAESVEVSVAGKAFARGALTGLIDGSLGGAAGELAMTVTDARTWRQSIWGVLGSAGAALLHGGLVGGGTGAITGGAMETATRLLQSRTLTGMTKLVIDEKMGAVGHINLTRNAEGAVEGMVLKFGKEISDADLAAHVERIAVIERANRLLGKAINFIKDEAKNAGTVSGDAAHEVRKIRTMIASRLDQMSGESSAAAAEVLKDEVAVLESNLNKFIRVAAEGDVTESFAGIGSPKAPEGFPDPPPGHHYRRKAGSTTHWEIQRNPGSNVDPYMLVSDGAGGWKFEPRVSTPDVPDGYPVPPEGYRYYRKDGGWNIRRYEDVASDRLYRLKSDGNGGFVIEPLDGKALKVAERFSEGATPAEAFEALAGKDSRSSFKQYFEMLEANGLATKDDVLGAMLDPAGRTHDVVRHALKEKFGPKIIEAAGPGEAAGIVKMRDFTKKLNSSDKGNLIEAWYAKHHPELIAHPKMTKADNPSLVGRDEGDVRTPDFVETEVDAVTKAKVDKGTIVELKSTSNGLNAEDVAQINDGLGVAESQGVVRVNGAPQKVDHLKVVFTDPKGAAASVKWLRDWLRNPHFTLEVFGEGGKLVKINRELLPQLFDEYSKKTGTTVSTLKDLLIAL